MILRMMILVLLAQVQEKKEPKLFGLEVTFARTMRGRTEDATWRIEKSSVEKLAQPGDDFDWNEAEVKGDLLAVKEGGTKIHVLESARDEIRIYSNRFGHFVLTMTIKKDLRPGMTWKGKEIVMSCGFISLPVEYVASAEMVTVPAGTFDAVRIDVKSTRARSQTLWIAKGFGIVKWSLPGQTLELK